MGRRISPNSSHLNRYGLPPFKSLVEFRRFIQGDRDSTQIDHGDVLNLGTSDFTFAVSFATESFTGVHQLLTKKGSGSPLLAGIQLFLEDNDTTVHISDTVSQVVASGTQNFDYSLADRVVVVGQRGGDTLSVYDMKETNPLTLIASTSGVDTHNVDSLDPLRAFTNGNNINFAGVAMERYAIWDTAASLNDIEALMNEPDPAEVVPSNFTGLQLYIPVNEGSGTVVNDLTSNNFDGTVSGSFDWTGNI